MSDQFFRKCSSCGRNVAVCDVAEFHNVGGFRGYSFTIACDCGTHEHIDGHDGLDIPESMKRMASQRRNDRSIKTAVDCARRQLNDSSAKAILKESMLDSPELLDDGHWIVYRLSNGVSISYCPETEAYHADGPREYPSLDSLVTHLQLATEPNRDRTKG